MLTNLLAVPFGLPWWLWYGALVVLVIILIISYGKYRKQMQ